MSKVSKHSAYLMAAYFITSALNYAFGVGLSWFFTPEEYGVQGVAQSLLLLLALVIGSGFAWTAAYDVASAEDPQSVGRRFRMAWLANLILGTILGVGTWLAYRSGLLNLGAAYVWIVPLISLTTVLLGVRAVSNGAMRGMYRFGALSVNLIGEVIVKVIVGLGLVALGWGVTGILVGFVAGAVVSWLHSLWVIRPAKLFSGSGWLVGDVVKQTLPLFISMLGTALMVNLDVLGLKLLSPVELGDRLSGYYQAAVILARTPVFLAQAVTIVMFSYIAGKPRAVGAVDQQAIRMAFRPWSRFLLPAGLVLMAAPQTVLLIFFPPQYQASAGLLRLAALGGVLLALVTLINGLLQAQGQRMKSAAVTALATGFQLVTLIWLVPVQGAQGAALSLVVASLAALGGYALLYIEKIRTYLFLNHFALNLGKVARFALPLIALLGVLLSLPEQTRSMALFKLARCRVGLSGCCSSQRTQSI